MTASKTRPILHGSNVSPYVRKIRVALAYKGIEYDNTQQVPFGAPPEFVNVLFLHGQRTRHGERLAVIGNVRSGGNRNQELTDSLQSAIHDAVSKAADLPQSEVSVRLIGFPASWGMEGGEILPEPGEEASWLNRGQD